MMIRAVLGSLLALVLLGCATEYAAQQHGEICEQMTPNGAWSCRPY